MRNNGFARAPVVKRYELMGDAVAGGAVRENTAIYDGAWSTAKYKLINHWTEMTRDLDSENIAQILVTLSYWHLDRCRYLWESTQ